MVDTAAGLYPWLPVKWVMQNRYDSIARIAKFDGPVLVSHGDRDTLIPIAHARKLYAAIGSDNKQFDVWTGAGHNEGPKLAYFAKLREFLAAADESQAVSAAAESP
jgi:pimeloyl-ACP methyl ester carboxylesterase